jgi:hypothetical protein
MDTQNKNKPNNTILLRMNSFFADWKPYIIWCSLPEGQTGKI